MQEEERNIEAKLADGVAHIKRTFKGDERMMMLQTYYRQNNYKPIYAMRGATSLLLQIPFFIAAFRFLSSYEPLAGVSFGLIRDLSKPDGILTVAGLSINILPLIMTGINIVSSRIYSKDLLFKDKVQLYVTAGVFLVLLYKSPSGLVFYWTLNNAFSLLKTIVFKTKDRKKTASIIASLLSIMIILFVLLFKAKIGENVLNAAVIASIVLQYPIVIYLIKKKLPLKEKKTNGGFIGFKELKSDVRLFVLSGLFISILTGVVIPSNVLSASPLEFTFTDYQFNPLWYLVSSFSIAFGTFVIWLGVFYWLFQERKRALLELFMVAFSFICACTYFIFGRNRGTLTPSLSYMDGLGYSYTEYILNFLLLILGAGIISVLYYKVKNRRKLFMPLIVAGCLALTVMSAINVNTVSSHLKSYYSEKTESKKTEIRLSKSDKNVAVIMIDRAMGAYIPYILNEKPELKEQFSGFTYYSNVISFGRSTNFGAPPLFGGYEYTPVELNTRKEESLKNKNNEAISVMPRIFGENNYHVTYINPIYANYYLKSDLSVFDGMKNVTATNLEELREDNSLTETTIDNNFRNFYLFGVMSATPSFIQWLIYDDGTYYVNNNVQSAQSPHRAVGNRDTFLKPYSVLENLSSITEVNDSNGEVLLFANNTTHENQLLQEPEYEPKDVVDNTEYDKNNKDRFTVNGRTLKMNSYKHYSHYQINVAALMQLGKWFDYLKKEGVYDNTKIIIVSDHGYGTGMKQLDELVIEDGPSNICDGEAYYPLLMVKDFNSKEFTESDEFMTNADVPTIAFDGVIENPINPYTGKAINSDEKFAHNQYIIASMDFDIAKNCSNQFNAARWYSVHDNIYDNKNWKRVADDAVLTKDDIKE